VRGPVSEPGEDRETGSRGCLIGCVASGVTVGVVLIVLAVPLLITGEGYYVDDPARRLGIILLVTGLVLLAAVVALVPFAVGGMSAVSGVGRTREKRTLPTPGEGGQAPMQRGSDGGEPPVSAHDDPE